MRKIRKYLIISKIMANRESQKALAKAMREPIRRSLKYTAIGTGDFMKTSEVTLWMMRGLPGSGKSTRAREIVDNNPNTVRLNKDQFREMMYFHTRGALGYRGQLEDAVQEAEAAAAAAALSRGYNVVIDDTNLKDEHEERWKWVARDAKANFEIVSLLDVPVSECVARDDVRENPVGRMAIYRMAHALGLVQPNNKPVELQQPYVVADLDGTIANIAHREDMLKLGADFSWQKFFDAMIDDVPREEIVSLIKDGFPGHPLVIITARPESYRDICEKWLKDWGITYHALLMRDVEDRRPDWVIKQELINNFLDKSLIAMWIDDRPSVIRQVRANGIPVCDVGPKVEF